MLDSKASCCLGNGDARQQNRLLHSNGGCWTAKPVAVQEMAMLDSKIVCCTATADAGQQSQLLSRKWRCQTAKSFAAQQRRMLDSKTSCCLANGDARQHVFGAITELPNGDLAVH